MLQESEIVLRKTFAPRNTFSTRFNAGLRLASMMRASIDLSPSSISNETNRNLLLSAYLGMCFHHTRANNFNEYKFIITVFAEPVWEVTCNNDFTEICFTFLVEQTASKFNSHAELLEIFNGIFRNYIYKNYESVIC